MYHEKLRYMGIYMYKQKQKRWKHIIFSIMSNFQINFCLQSRLKHMGHMVIDGIKHRKDNQLQSLHLAPE